MIEKNIKIFKWYYFFWRFKPLAVMMIIYFSQITASYTQAMAIFAINNLAYAFFKIPGGFFSDQIGRKPIILLGSILIAISFLPFRDSLILNGFYSFLPYYGALEKL